jgi:hypothetical protein
MAARYCEQSRSYTPANIYEFLETHRYIVLFYYIYYGFPFLQYLVFIFLFSF